MANVPVITSVFRPPFVAHAGGAFAGLVSFTLAGPAKDPVAFVPLTELALKVAAAPFRSPFQSMVRVGEAALRASVLHTRGLREKEPESVPLVILTELLVALHFVTRPFFTVDAWVPPPEFFSAGENATVAEKLHVTFPGALVEDCGAGAEGDPNAGAGTRSPPRRRRGKATILTPGEPRNLRTDEPPSLRISNPPTLGLPRLRTCTGRQAADAWRREAYRPTGREPPSNLPVEPPLHRSRPSKFTRNLLPTKPILRGRPATERDHCDGKRSTPRAGALTVGEFSTLKFDIDRSW